MEQNKEMYIVVLSEVLDCTKIDVYCLCSVRGIYCTKWMMLDMLDVVFTVYIGYTLYSLPTVML